MRNAWMFRRRKTLIISRKSACETEFSSLLLVCSLHMVFSFSPSWTKNFTNLTYFTSRKTITRHEEFSSKRTDRQVCVLFQNTVSKALSFLSVSLCTSLWQMLDYPYQQRTRKQCANGKLRAVSPETSNTCWIWSSHSCDAVQSGKVHSRFGGTYCFHLQCRRVSQASNNKKKIEQSSSLCNFLNYPVTSFLLGPNFPLRILFSKTLCSSLIVRGQVIHPYKTTHNSIVTCISDL
jgi:hypothetical protein